VPVRQKALAQVRADQAGGAGNQDAFARVHGILSSFSNRTRCCIGIPHTRTYEFSIR
jgi:hypothetical protein